MNEHKKYIRQQEKFASNHEISLAELNSLLGLLYSRARDVGAVAVLIQLEQLRKTLAKIIQTENCCVPQKINWKKYNAN